MDLGKSLSGDCAKRKKCVQNKKEEEVSYLLVSMIMI